MTSSFVGNTQAFQAQVAAARPGHVRTSTHCLRTHRRPDRLPRVLAATVQLHAIDVTAGQACHGHA